SALTLAVLLRRPAYFSWGYLLFNINLFWPLFPAWFLTFYVLGLYDIKQFNKIEYLSKDCIISFTVNLFIGIGFFYVFHYKNLSTAPKINLLTTVAITALLMFLWRRLWTKYILIKVLNEKVIFLGDNPLIRMMKKDLSQKPHLGFTVKDISDIEAVRQGIKNKKINLIIVDGEEIEKDSKLSKEIISLAVSCSVTIINHLDFYETVYHKISLEYTEKPSLLFSHMLGRHDRFYLFVKEKFDVVIAIISLIPLAPLFIILALFSFIIDRHNPVYTQKRTGYLGREFTIIKLRTMKRIAEKLGPMYETEEKDERVTFFGKLLRRFRIDELPQLINVAKGDMSLVGPRPEWAREVKILAEKIPYYSLRHLVKPGVTGWAQVKFKSTHNTAESLEKLRYDLYYVKNVSFMLDLKIILGTIRRVFASDEHYKVEG
ncbi:MAG TPA: sugar transferase, partial [Elusimicrobiales bacterium]|nr:sugar transferase [Elusimicrobiales bacterium]